MFNVSLCDYCFTLLFDGNFLAEIFHPLSTKLFKKNCRSISSCYFRCASFCLFSFYSKQARKMFFMMQLFSTNDARCLTPSPFFRKIKLKYKQHFQFHRWYFLRLVLIIKNSTCTFLHLVPCAFLNSM